MDYKYIEQLLERYWQCQATLDEEAILRAFFRQEEVPAELLVYRPLFAAPAEERASVATGEAFDKRLMAALGGGEPAVKARTITLSQRLRPLWRSVASVAVLLTLGMAAEMSLEPSDAPYPGEAQNQPQVRPGRPVAVGDSVKTDSLTLAKPSAEAQ